MRSRYPFSLAKHVMLFIYFVIISFASTAQVPQWAIKLGGTGSDESFYSKVAPNGNVLVGGKFSGTIDLDPSANTHNITSNGSEDLFLACYTSGGAFLWGFGIGGSDIDGLGYISFDSASDVIVAGYFRGQNIDFDPSAAVNALSDNGLAGTYDPPYGGDAFVAKYSSTGVYQWAFNLGGQFRYDDARGLATDEHGNIYVTVWYTDVMDVDPSPAVLNVSSITNGKIYLGKYSPSGQLIWGEAFATQGGAGIDAAGLDLVYKHGFLYLVGAFQINADFDPSATTTSITAVGSSDGFLAKYDSAGHFVFVRQQMGSGGLDGMYSVTLDSLNNIYTIGYSDGATISFPPSTTTLTSPGGGGNQDIILTKYNDSGTLQWAKAIGSSQTDIGYGIVVAGNKIYCTGSFGDTVDFDPSAAVANLVSSSTGDDIFLTTYDLNGNYLCGFNVGGANVHDEGFRVSKDAQNNIYLTGQFDGANIDFDPTATSLQLSSSGMGDGFLVKYPGACGGGGESVKGTSPVIDIDLYPNPAFNEAYLVCDVAKYPGATAGIYDITGRLVAKLVLSSVKTMIPISTLQPGLYQCKIDLPGQGVLSKKLVVVR